MNLERAREFLLSLPHVVETEQWGGLVFWVGDKAVAGKMFVMANADASDGKIISYPAGEERFHELCEREGIVPAPYMARLFWVAAERWDVFRNSEWEDELRAAHALTFAKMPAKVRAILELPKAELKRAIDAGRKKRAEWEAKEVIRKAAKRKTKSPMKLG
jgi:predicted DNA-binding protein (MmcQ/YjbR family)